MIPSIIIKNILKDEGITGALQKDPFYMYVGYLPDNVNDLKLDYTCAVIDNGVISKGSSLRTGRMIVDYKVILLVRSIEYISGWGKINEIVNFLLDSVNNLIVENDDGELYSLGHIRNTCIEYLGVDDVNRRFLFSSNLVLSVNQC